jgi:hypothetical protein
MRWLLAIAVVACAHKFVPEEAAHVDRNAPTTGAKAPSITLVTPSGSTVALADVIGEHANTIVVWYRGFY